VTSVSGQQHTKVDVRIRGRGLLVREVAILRNDRERGRHNYHGDEQELETHSCVLLCVAPALMIAERAAAATTPAPPNDPSPEAPPQRNDGGASKMIAILCWRCTSEKIFGSAITCVWKEAIDSTEIEIRNEIGNSPSVVNRDSFSIS
jgi:hypothetical protein